MEETPKEVEVAVAVVEEELVKEKAQETLEDGLVLLEILAVVDVPTTLLPRSNLYINHPRLLGLTT